MTANGDIRMVNAMIIGNWSKMLTGCPGNVRVAPTFIYRELTHETRGFLSGKAPFFLDIAFFNNSKDSVYLSNAALLLAFA